MFLRPHHDKPFRTHQTISTPSSQFDGERQAMWSGVMKKEREFWMHGREREAAWGGSARTFDEEILAS